METRKLQQIKTGTFVLSLPRSWVKKNGLEPKSRIVLDEEEDGSLRLYPDQGIVQETLDITLNLDDLEFDTTDLQYCVFTHYIQGRDKISIISERPIPLELKKNLKKLLVELPGTIVVPEEANKLIFKILISPKAFSLEDHITEASAFSLSLQRDAVQSLTSQNVQSANEVIERSQEAKGHYRMTVRQVALASLNRNLAKEMRIRNCHECITFALIARDIFGLIRHSASIARQVVIIGDEIVQRESYEIIDKMSQITYEMQRDAVHAFLKKDIKLAMSVMSKMDKVRTLEKELMAHIETYSRNIQNTRVSGALRMVGSDLRRIAGYSIAISDDAMNRILAPKPSFLR